MRKPMPSDHAIDAPPAAGVLDWLLAGDPAIGWQAERDLLGRPRSRYEATRRQVQATGWAPGSSSCAPPTAAGAVASTRRSERRPSTPCSS